VNAAAWAVLGAAALAAASVVVYALRVGITPTPSSRAAREKILSLLPEDARGTVLELGCGWGGLAVALARRFPEARIRAYELSPVPWLVSWLRARLGRHGNLEVRRRDFLREPLGDADAAVAYLYVGGMAKLGPKLARELRPGTPVVSHVFAIPGWEAEKEVGLEDVWRSRVRLYMAPGAS
jgi:trans-aconitate methyltransferase